MTTPEKVVFLLEGDNTLLETDLKNHLEREFGPESRDRSDRQASLAFRGGAHF